MRGHCRTQGGDTTGHGGDEAWAWFGRLLSQRAQGRFRYIHHKWGFLKDRKAPHEGRAMGKTWRRKIGDIPPWDLLGMGFGGVCAGQQSDQEHPKLGSLRDGIFRVFRARMILMGPFQHITFCDSVISPNLRTSLPLTEKRGQHLPVMQFGILEGAQ